MTDQRPKPYPLQWPPGVPRTQRGERTEAQFKTTMSVALENVRRALKAFGRDTGKAIDPSDIVISTNVALGETLPADTGIAIWFLWEGEWRSIGVDRYLKAAHNVQAVYHVIEAERTKMRHGGLHIVRATFRAFLALPASGPSWWEVLKVSPASGVEDIKAAHRALSKKAHPDSGGSHAAMTELNTARDQGLAHRGAP